jgi:membrane protein DedA with SNARE-associated domain
LVKRKPWGTFFMFGALAVTVYWPVVHLFAIYSGRSSMNLSADKYLSYSVILPLIALYGLWGMWFLYRNRAGLSASA